MVLPPTPIGVAHGGESQSPSTMSEAGGNRNIRMDENKDIIVQRDFVSHFSTTTNASSVGSFITAVGGPGTTTTSSTAAHRGVSTVPNGFDELFELYERR